MSTLSMWCVGGTRFVIAEDVADARAVLTEWEVLTGDLQEDAFVRLPDGEPFAVLCKNGTVTKTRGEWVAERGRGYLASMAAF